VYLCASHYESFPLPPLEAMACGAPVVTTANVGVLEYARDAQNAVVVPIGDVAAMKAAIGRVLDEGGPAATPALYAAMPAISIDHGVMERLSDLLCVAGDFGWNDVGSWSALAEIAPAGADGNVRVGQVIAAGGASGNIAVAEQGLLIALIGVHDLVVVHAGDAVLVVPAARAQEVREAVAALGRAGLDRFL
jgi:mannose-1-phosphate guanylyltransferase